MQIFKNLLDKIIGVFRKFREWRYDHLLLSKLLVPGLIIICMAGLLVMTRTIPKTSTERDTALNSYIDVGTSGSYQIEMLSRSYNKEQNFMVIKFQVKGQTNQTVAMDDIKLKLAMMRKQNLSYSVIPLANDQIVMVINNLKPGYRALQITVSSKSADSTQLQSEIGSDPLEESSSSSMVTSSSKSENSTKIYINESNKFVNNKTKKYTQKQYAIQALNTSIKTLEGKRDKVNKLIEDYNNQISTDNKKITEANIDSQYEASDSSSSNSDASNYQNDISQINDSIQDAQDNKKIINEQIRLYRKQIQDIKDGKYQFTSTTKTTKIGE